eukprot:4367446-Amphidinium_carterae.2
MVVVQKPVDRLLERTLDMLWWGSSGCCLGSEQESEAQCCVGSDGRDDTEVAVLPQDRRLRTMERNLHRMWKRR